MPQLRSLTVLLAVVISLAALLAYRAPAAQAAVGPDADRSRVTPVLNVADIEIAHGQTVPVEDGAIDLTFVRVVEDSRCPANALCYWQGRAVVELQVRHLDGTVTAELLTTAVVQGKQPAALGLAMEGYVLFLHSLTPYPGSGGAQSDPTVLTVRVTRP